MENRHHFWIFVISLSLTCLFAGGGVAYLFLPNQLGEAKKEEEKKEKKEAKPLLVRTRYLRREVVEPVKPLQGRLAAVRQATISSEVAGRLLELPLEVGDYVYAPKVDNSNQPESRPLDLSDAGLRALQKRMANENYSDIMEQGLMPPPIAEPPASYSTPTDAPSVDAPTSTDAPSIDSYHAAPGEHPSTSTATYSATTTQSVKTGHGRDGTLLARVDRTWIRLAIRKHIGAVLELRTQARSTTSELRYANVEYARRLKLGKQTILSASALDKQACLVETLQAKLGELENQINTGLIAIQEEWERYLRADIYAPFDGIVIKKYAEVGELLSLDTPIVDIISRGKIYALIYVPETIAGKDATPPGVTDSASKRRTIELGDEIEVQIDPFLPSDEKVTQQERKSLVRKGKVVSILAYGTTATRTFPVRIELDDENGYLRAGYSVTAMVPTGPKHTSFVVNRDGVLVSPAGDSLWAVTQLKKNAKDEKEGIARIANVRITEKNVRFAGKSRELLGSGKGYYAIEPVNEKAAELLKPRVEVLTEGAETAALNIKKTLNEGQKIRILTNEDD